MRYRAQHSARANRPTTGPVFLAAALTTGAATAAHMQSKDSVASASTAAAQAGNHTSASRLLAERAHSITVAAPATVTSSRYEFRPALTHALASTSPFRAINPARTPAVPATLTTIAPTDTRATAKLRSALADAVEHMGLTRQAFERSTGAASAASIAMTATQSALATGAHAPLVNGDVSTPQLATLRAAELHAADAHRESIARVLELRTKVEAAASADIRAAQAKVDARVRDGSLVRLPDGSTVGTPALGTPIPGNGFTLTAPVRGWIAQALTTLYANGFPRHDNDFMSIAMVVYNESGGQPGALNDYDSNAAMGIPSFGLMQTIGPTFDAYALPGHTTKSDPIAQIMAGARYGVATYHSLTNIPGVRNLNAGGGYLPY